MEVKILIRKQSQENIDEIQQAEDLDLPTIPKEEFTNHWCDCTISNKTLRDCCFAYWFEDEDVKQIRLQLSAEDGGVLFLTYTNELWNILLTFHKGPNDV